MDRPACLYLPLFLSRLDMQFNNGVCLFQDEFLHWTNYLREFMCAVTLIIFLFHVAKYRDYNAIINALLTNMGNRMDLTMEYVEEGMSDNKFDRCYPH